MPVTSANSNEKGNKKTPHYGSPVLKLLPVINFSFVEFSGPKYTSLRGAKQAVQLDLCQETGVIAREIAKFLLEIAQLGK